MRADRFYAEGAVAPALGTWSAREATSHFNVGSEPDRQRVALLKRALAASEYVSDAPTSTVEGAAAAGSASAPAGGRRLFEFLVAQLSEADVVAHCSGAAPRIDPSGGYVHALANTSDLLGDVLRDLDSRTTLLIVSDHVTAVTVFSNLRSPDPRRATFDPWI